MGKTKEKKGKVQPPANPFESTESKSGKNGEKKSKNKTGGQEYPTEINPFEMKPTKSMKKRDKEKKMERKREKKEQKLKAKLERGNDKVDGGKANKNKVPIVVKAVEVEPNENAKENNNHEGSKPSSPANSSSTLPYVRDPVTDSTSQIKYEKQLSQTLDIRSPTQPAPASPQLPNKRVLQLKTSREALPRGRNAPPSSPESSKKTHYQYSPALPKSATISKEGSGPVTPSAANVRPRSLELKVGAHVLNRGLSPVQEYRSPSPLVSRPHTESEDVKMYRTASISKKGKNKKKKRKLKRILKKKKKSKDGKPTNLLEDQAATDQVVMRRPKVNNIDTLQQQVVEVQESARTSIINLVEQRNSALDLLTQSTKELEDFSLGFATVAQEARLKHQSRLTCCGIGKNWKFCWYICACERGIRKKNKKKDQAGKNSKGEPESHELLSGRPGEDDDDDYYRPATKSRPVSEAGLPPRTISGQSSSTSHSLDGNIEDQGPPSSLRSKLAKIPQAIRGSMPSLLVDGTPPMGQSLRSMANVDPRGRKSSSVSALQEIVKTRAEKKREEKKKKVRVKQEEEIEKFASQYDDEETRKKVEDLLRLDL